MKNLKEKTERKNLNTENVKKEIHNAFRKYKSSVGVYGSGSEVAENDEENLISLLHDASLSKYIQFTIFGAGYEYLVNLRIYGETDPRTIDSAYYFENLLIN